MPPQACRESAGAAASAEEEEEEACLPASFTSLPRVLQHAIFVRMPVDARARCAAMCRGWRDTLVDVSLWTRLDLSPSSGVTCTVNDAALRGASGLARGGLTALDVSRCWRVTHETLLAVVTSNAGALTELCMHAEGYHRDTTWLTCPYDAEALLLAAPLLRVLDADVSVDATEAPRLLRNEEPFGPLRVRHLEASFFGRRGAGTEAALTAAIAAHASLSSVRLSSAPLDAPAALDVFVDAVLLRRVQFWELDACDLTPASAPSLARLLSGSALTELRIWNDGQQLLDASAAALLAAALRTNSTLTSLSIRGAAMWDDAAAAAMLLGALTAHASIRSLQFHNAIHGDQN
jgi:hypothetical protein